ncbi:MAG: polyphosphate kinase 2 family protein [Chloroflexi bacterium]|nr:polyphosphate kinase 2 family protein [Chloroflexota bacterium]
MADVDIRPKRIAEFIEPFRVKPGRKVRLPADFDPSGTRKVSKSQAKEILAAGVELLSEYQDKLAAQDTYGVVIVLQAMDAAGKDGTIKHVMSGVNPQGVTVDSFKIPSAEELDHDYLWRYQRELPARGHIGIFNRSHYEEVLVVRVHPQILAGQKLPAKMKGRGVWQRRFREINDWERYLTDQGFRFVKLFLNLSKEEQRRRFLARIDRPEKNWKFSSNDAKERGFWDDYQKAFADVLTNTSTEWAPWWVIPADDKPFARVAAAAVIANALIELDPKYPKVTREQLADLQVAKETLEAEAPEGAAPDPYEAELEAKKAEDDGDGDAAADGGRRKGKGKRKG